MTTEITVTDPACLPSSNNVCNFFDLATYKEVRQVAADLAKSKLIPQNFQNNVPDCIIAMEMAQRIGASIFAVMQSLYIVHGKPGWSAQFVIAALNSCWRFAPLRFEITGDGEDRSCVAWTLEKGTNERLSGPPVSIDMAKKEGWYGKNGSKWQTMPELMLRYRAATFFGRLYAPDILMGMRTMEELIDTPSAETEQGKTVVDDLNEKFKGEVVDESVQPTIGDESVCNIDQQEDKNTFSERMISTSKEMIKKFMREIDANQTSLSVDQWRAKHNKRVAHEFGGVDSECYAQIMDYAEIKFRELAESETGKVEG